MEERLPRQTIKQVKLNRGYLQTSPCQHTITFSLHNQDKEIPARNIFVEADKVFTFSTYFSSKDIAEQYAEFLDPYDFVHIPLIFQNAML